MPTIAVPCPKCGISLQVNQTTKGKVRCPRCQTVFAPSGSVSSPTAALPSAHSPKGETQSDLVQSVDQVQDTLGIDEGGGKNEFDGFLAPPRSPGELGWLGPYRVLKVLGQGGMGVVFLAEDPALQRKVALKAMLPKIAKNASAKERFLREGRTAARLKHDHIVNIFQVGEDRGIPFLAIEFLEGEPLDERLKREQRLPILDVLGVGRQIADGLAAAHEQQLIHRDIKPANIWLERRSGTRRKSADESKPRVKILDFGLAKESSDEHHLTQSGMIVGTPAYMPPEQAGSGEVDHRADLYSLGVVLYRMATGDVPIKGANTITLLSALALQAPRPPVECNPQIPPALNDLILKLLAKKPEDRPQSAEEVATALESIEQSLTAIAPSSAAAPTMTAFTAAIPSKTRMDDSPISAPASRSRLRWPLVFVALLILAGLGYYAAQIVIVRDKDGNEIARIKVPEGGKVEIKEDGKKTPDVPEITSRLSSPSAPQVGNRSPSANRHSISWTRRRFRRRNASTGSPRNSSPSSAVMNADNAYPIQWIDWSRDGRWIATVSWFLNVGLGHPAESCIYLWDAATLKLHARIPTTAGQGALACAFTPDSKCIAIGDKNGIRLYDFTAPKPDYRPWGSNGPLELPGGYGLGLRFSANARTLAGFSQDGKVKVWDLGEAPRLLHTLQGGGFEPHSSSPFDMSADGKTIAYCSKQTKDRAHGVSVVDISGNVARELTFIEQTEMAAVCALTPDGKRLFVMPWISKGPIVYDFGAGPLREIARGSVKGDFGFSRFAPDGAAICVPGHNPTNYFTLTGDQLVSGSFGNSGQGMFSSNVADFSPDGKRIAFGNNTIRVRRLEGGSWNEALPLLPPGPIFGSSELRDQHSLASVSGLNGLFSARREDGTAQLYSFASKSPVPWPVSDKSTFSGSEVIPSRDGTSALVSAGQKSRWIRYKTDGTTEETPIKLANWVRSSFLNRARHGLVQLGDKNSPWSLWDISKPPKSARALPKLVLTENYLQQYYSLLYAVDESGQKLAFSDLAKNRTELWDISGTEAKLSYLIPAGTGYPLFSLDGNLLVMRDNLCLFSVRS